MNCAEVREYLFAFLDSELDAPLSIEIQRHLDGCAVCAREAEIERAIRKRLHAACETSRGGVPQLETMAAAILTEPALKQGARAVETSARTWYTGRRLAAAAVVLVAGSALWVAISSITDSDAASGVPSFAELLTRDFEHFLQEGGKLQIASADGGAVTDWLRHNTLVAVTLPRLSGTSHRLLGGRKCKIAERPAAFAVYDIDGTPASLVTVSAAHVDWGGMREARYGDDTYRIAQRRGFSIVACQRGEWAVAAVSRAPHEKLLVLLSGAVDEID